MGACVHCVLYIYVCTWILNLEFWRQRRKWVGRKAIATHWAPFLYAPYGIVSPFIRHTVWIHIQCTAHTLHICRDVVSSSFCTCFCRLLYPLSPLVLVLLLLLLLFLSPPYCLRSKPVFAQEKRGAISCIRDQPTIVFVRYTNKHIHAPMNIDMLQSYKAGPRKIRRAKKQMKLILNKKKGFTFALL